MSEQLELSAEEWDHELRYMANAGFDDLYHITLGHDQNGNPYSDLPKTIKTGFGLVADGMGMTHGDLASNLAEFLKAAEATDPVVRTKAMQMALSNLSSVFGFKIGE